MAEAFNSYFSNVGVDFAAEIPASEVYLTPTGKTFNLQTRTIDRVHGLLKTIHENKSVCLDKIPNKLLNC
jgi:hypothetical protein